MTTPNEALEAAREFVEQIRRCCDGLVLTGPQEQYAETWKLRATAILATLLAQRDAQVEAATLERAAQRAEDVGNIDRIDDFNWKQGYRGGRTDAAMEVRSLGPDPTYLERERLNARIGECDFQLDVASVAHPAGSDFADHVAERKADLESRRAELEKLRETPAEREDGSKKP
jgi:hypothetical protein